ncbi:hypothetical protein Glove_606g26 [Diversispora epigaea]|uniref:DNA 3'-5' helicase n=1 Tax=Diversispora epigaea TaxID=1348612 RepID=A0A397GBU6_9GLOM|nr:hypothetical protein Glove_606g26 [Diversispora epigaea]
MGINVPDVRVVIHTSFPISMGNLVQESGRAGCDGLPAKSIVIEENEEIQNIEHNKYLSKAKQKIREVLFYCSSIYQCRKKIIIDYFAWPEDSSSNECNICDNCLRRINDKPVQIDVQTDVKKILEIVETVTNDMILRGLIKENIILTKLASTQTLICSVFILGITDEAITKAYIENWKYFIKTGR